MSFLSNLFSSGPKVDLNALIREGALIIDVRTKGEYAAGHIKNSKNIPLDELGKALPKFKKEQNIIVVCASGSRSGSAVSIMKRNGFTNCYNGGSWMNFR